MKLISTHRINNGFQIVLIADFSYDNVEFDGFRNVFMYVTNNQTNLVFN